MPSICAVRRRCVAFAVGRRALRILGKCNHKKLHINVYIHSGPKVKFQDICAVRRRCVAFAVDPFLPGAVSVDTMTLKYSTCYGTYEFSLTVIRVFRAVRRPCVAFAVYPITPLCQCIDSENTFSDTRKRQADSMSSPKNGCSPPPKQPNQKATPDPPKKNHRGSKGNKTNKSRKRGPRSDKVLRERGCEMVYVTNEGKLLSFDNWKAIEYGIHDRIWAMDPDDTAFPEGGFPRIARMAFNGGGSFMACMDKATAAWTQSATTEIMSGVGIGVPSFSDEAPHESHTAYCAVLPGRATTLGPERAAMILLRQNRWPGTARPIRGFVRPSSEGDKRDIVLLYFTADKEAEEAFVQAGLAGFFGGAEFRLRRKRRGGDGSILVDPTADAKANNGSDVPPADPQPSTSK